MAADRQDTLNAIFIGAADHTIGYGIPSPSHPFLTPLKNTSRVHGKSPHDLPFAVALDGDLPSARRLLSIQ
jgi:hypothetical protein